MNLRFTFVIGSAFVLVSGCTSPERLYSSEAGGGDTDGGGASASGGSAPMANGGARPGGGPSAGGSSSNTGGEGGGSAAGGRPGNGGTTPIEGGPDTGGSAGSGGVDGGAPPPDASTDGGPDDAEVPDASDASDEGPVVAVCGDGVTTPPEACDDGFRTSCGACNATCTGPGAGGNACGDGIRCSDVRAEACDDGKRTACGSCNAMCTGPGTGGNVCGDGIQCSDVTAEACDDGGATACGACNVDCSGPGSGVPEVICDGTACSDGTIEQTFSGGMVGCAGVQTFPNRAAPCGGGCTVCTAEQWIDGYGTAAPTHHYWTNDHLRYSGEYGVGSGALCSVGLSDQYDCGADAPMRVCVDGDGVAPTLDPEGNACNWSLCGLGTISRNDHFGGCAGNLTAGTLCCCN